MHILMTALLALAGASKAPPPPCVPVFVTSVGEQGGLTDPSRDNQDTKKNLLSALYGKKAVCVVREREKATIILQVLARERAQMSATAFGPGRDCIVRVKFIFGDFETEMMGSAMGGTLGTAWGKAAGKVAKQVEQWVIANREKLDAQR